MSAGSREVGKRDRAEKQPSIKVSFERITAVGIWSSSPLGNLGVSSPKTKEAGRFALD